MVKGRTVQGVQILLVITVTVLIVGGGIVSSLDGITPRIDADTPHSANDDVSTQNSEPWFVNVSGQVGFEYVANDSYRPDTDEVTNAGVYSADFNRDGWTDILAVGGDEPVLFENVGGEFRRSEALSLPEREVQAALFFDYDSDGWDDLLILSLQRSPLLLHNEEGSFKRVNVGLNRTLSHPTGATAADYNDDGCLDLFIIQTGNWSSGRPTSFRYNVTPHTDNGGQNLLYRGTCSRFVNVTGETGINESHWSLAASFIDFTNDGAPDIHVANDFHRDALYINRGNNTFERRTLGRLLTIDGKQLLGPRTNRNAMSSEFGDINGDGLLDLFVTNIYSVVDEYVRGPSGDLESSGNNLYLGRGNGTFEERSTGYGIDDGGWGWAAVIADLDNDGDSDIAHTTSTLDLSPTFDLTYQDIQHIYENHPSYQYPVLFEQREEEWFGMISPNASGFEKSDGRGIAQLDYDRDGDLDFVLADAKGTYKLYENRQGDTDNTALQIDLRGTDDILATGTRVQVTGDDQTYLRVRSANADFLSQDSRISHFGTNDSRRVDIRIMWSDGSIEQFDDVRTDQRVIITPDRIVERIPFSDS